MPSPAKAAQTAPFNLNIERSTLLKSISKLQSIVEKRNTLPILANVKLEAEGEILRLTVTDMDILAIEEIPANIQSAGSLTVPAVTLYDVIRKLPDGSQVQLINDEASSQVIVTSGSSRFNLSYLPANDFPSIAEGEYVSNFSLNVKDLTKLIEKSRFAMSTEETRYYLNGVYFHINGEKLSSVATDGHRLAKVEIIAPEGSKNMPGVIIPRKTVNEIVKMLEGQTEVQISVSDQKIKFVSGQVSLLSKLIDGTFPDYQRVIPQNNQKILNAATQSFKQTVDRVSTINNDKTKAIKLAIEPGNIHFTAQAADGGSGKDDLPVDYNGDKLEIGFNSRYLLEMMEKVEGANTAFAFDNPSAPAVVTDPNDTSVLFIIMPMRV